MYALRICSPENKISILTLYVEQHMNPSRYSCFSNLPPQHHQYLSLSPSFCRWYSNKSPLMSAFNQAVTILMPPENILRLCLSCSYRHPLQSLPDSHHRSPMYRIFSVKLTMHPLPWNGYNRERRKRVPLFLQGLFFADCWAIFGLLSFYACVGR